MQTHTQGPRNFLWLATLILLGGFFVRVWKLSSVSFWSDELFTIFFARAPFERFFELLLVDAVHVPFYFMLMRLVPSDHELIVRLPSVMAGELGIGLLMYVVRRLYHNHRMALWAGALLAFNPYHVWLSRMARPYALFFVMALLVACYFLILLHGERTWLNWLVFLVASTVAYLTHFFAVALPMAQFLLMVWVLRDDRLFLRIWLAVQLIAGIPLLIWLYALSQQELVSFGIAWIPEVTVFDVPRTFWSLTTGYDDRSVWYLLPVAIIAMVGLGLGTWRALRGWRTNYVDFYWAWLIYPPVGCVFLISLGFRSVYVDRYFTVLLPAVLILMVGGWQGQRRWGALMLAVLVLSGAAYTVAVIADGRDERQDWQEAMAYVHAHYEVGDGFVMQEAIAILPFRRYYGDEKQYAEVRFDYEELAAIPASMKRIWVIYHNPRQNIHRQIEMPEADPLVEGLSPVTGWLAARRDQVVVRKDFRGVTVLLLENRAETVSRGATVR